jgi:hypothetical protein
LRSAKYITGRVLQMLSLHSHSAAPFHDAPFSTLYDILYSTIQYIRSSGRHQTLFGWWLGRSQCEHPHRQVQREKDILYNTVRYIQCNRPEASALVNIDSIITRIRCADSRDRISYSTMVCRVHKIAACVSSIFTCSQRALYSMY